MKFSIGIQSDTLKEEILLGQILTDIFNDKFQKKYEKEIEVIYVSIIFISDSNDKFLKDFYKPKSLTFLRNEPAIEIEFQSDFNDFVKINSKKKKLIFLTNEIKRYLNKLRKSNKRINTKISELFFEDLKKIQL